MGYSYSPFGFSGLSIDTVVLGVVVFIGFLVMIKPKIPLVNLVFGLVLVAVSLVGYGFAFVRSVPYIGEYSRLIVCLIGFVDLAMFGYKMKEG